MYCPCGIDDLFLRFPRCSAGAGLPDARTISPELQELVGARPAPYWNTHPANAGEWKSWVESFARGAVKRLADLREQVGVSVTRGELGGVPVFTFTPKDLPEANRDRVLLNLHGGGYVLGPGESGTLEATLMAGIGKFRSSTPIIAWPPISPIRRLSTTP